jgi:hypothetical protein
VDIKPEAPGSVGDLPSPVANGRVQVKRERNDDSGHQRRKRSRGSNIETIDLTGD